MLALLPKSLIKSDWVGRHDSISTESLHIALRGTAKVDRRTKDLVKRLKPGDIAVIDHADLDQVAAESLVKARVRAVINASKSISGRYPNLGPRTIVEAGIILLDEVGSAVMQDIAEGDLIEIINQDVIHDGQVVASGTIMTADRITELMDAAEANLADELDKFIQNTLDFAVREKDLILGRMELPELHTAIAGKHVLIVVRGHYYREDLSTISSYIREMKPVLVGVDGGADALLECGYLPDIIIGDMDSITDEALRCGAELIVHAYSDGRAPGLERLRKMDLEPLVLPAPGTSEDVALLLAYEKGAALIVAVGTHSNMIDFLEKGRKGMASTFLSRLKVGSILVDAKGVSMLYRGRMSARYLLWIGLAAALTMVIIIGKSDLMRQYFELLWMKIRIILGL